MTHCLHRTPDTLAQNIGDETIVYHPETNQATLLGPLASEVYETVETISCEQAEAMLQTPTDSTDERAQALVELLAKDLVRFGDGFDRRQFLAQAAQVAAVPFLVSILAPTPAQAASPGTVSFTTAGTFSYTVPVGVTSVTATVVGGDGGLGGDVSGGVPRFALGARGATSTGTFPVGGGDILNIVVGGVGGRGGQGTPSGGGAGGFGGLGSPMGANGGFGFPATTSGFQGGGGGGGAGGSSAISGPFSLSAQGGTGGGGFAAVTNQGIPGTSGGAGATASPGWGNGGDGGPGAVGTGNGTSADGSVTLLVS